MTKTLTLDWYGIRIIKLGVAFNTFGDIVIWEKADLSSG